MARISAIVLAAGLSRRLGRNKLLLPLGGETVVRKTTQATLASPVSEVVVVTGHAQAAVREALDGLDVRFVHNPRYAEGQSTSMIAGINAAHTDTGAYLFVLGDQPLLTPEIVRDMLRLYEASEPKALVVAPTCGDRRGNPTLFSALLRDELLGVRGGRGRAQRHQKRWRRNLPRNSFFLRWTMMVSCSTSTRRKTTGACSANFPKPRSNRQGIRSW